MEGTFQYNVTEWKPEVHYSLDGSQGTLRIDQPRHEPARLVKNGENVWDIRLGESHPIELEVRVGAGESQLDVTKINLSGLTIDTGMGGLELDLRGNWNHNLDIAISSGLGEVTIHLPAEIGARVEVSNGLGKVSEKGLEKDGKAYVNGSYGKTPYTLNIRIDNGAGIVNLDA